MTAKLQAIPQITIAAINGGALGGGAVIVSALDFRIGAEGCFVSYPEINLGMNLSWYGLALCVRLVGPARAKRFVILGQKESAETLLNWGFLDEVIKRSANALASALDQAIMHMDTDQFMLTTMSEDYREGIAAFREKRAPEF
jgi:enoyl-CoA hydratase/carnithine racemase